MDRPGELTHLELRLGTLRPSPLPIDRDRMMYLAGRASADRGARGRILAGAACAGLALVCAGLGTRLSSEREQRLVLERAVAQHRRDRLPERLELFVREARPEPSSYFVLTHPAKAGGGVATRPSEVSHPEESADRDLPLSPLSARGSSAVAF